MDTRYLRLFVLAVDKMNISAAGRAMGLAPSVASAWMAKLEHDIGADLLHRTTRKISLAAEGEAFVPHARDILAREDAARAALGQGVAEVSGTLRFTAPSTFAQAYIAPILPDFLAQHPKLVVDMRLSDTQFDLVEDSFDLALRNAPLAGSSLRGRKLADDHRILCASPDYLAKHGTPQSPQDLGSHSFIAFGGFQTSTLVNGSGTSFRVSPDIGRSQLIIDDGHTLRVATRAGAGISVNSLWSVHEDLAAGRLLQVLPDWRFQDSSGLWLIYPKSNVLSGKVRVFLDFLVERIGRHPPWTSTD